MKYTYLLLGCFAVMLLGGCLNQKAVSSPITVDSFATCAAAGNPVMESYPRQCRHQGVNYVEDIGSPVGPDDNIAGRNCDSAQDCPLPGAYAVRSDCPYSTACRQGRCVIICPLKQYEPMAESGVGRTVVCQTSSDCDCSFWIGEGNYRCACFDGQCAAVVAE